ncbi:hypothetical protein D3C84_755980 [compost metagenome]
MVLHQYPVAGDQSDTVKGRQPGQRDVGRGGHPHRLLAVELGDFLQHLGVDIGPGGQHHARIDLQFDVAGAADDHVHAHDLRAAGALGEQGLKRRRAVGHGYQIVVRVVQADFANPPAADILRNDLLGDDDPRVDGIDLELIQRRTTALVDQCRLRRRRLRLGAIGVTDAHLSDFPRGA